MTSEEQESTQTQVEEAPKSRSLDELLALDSYQTMTDDEITAVLEYRIMIERANARTEARNSATLKIFEEQSQALKKAAEKSAAMLEELALMTPYYKSVSDGS